MTLSLRVLFRFPLKMKHLSSKHAFNNIQSEIVSMGTADTCFDRLTPTLRVKRKAED